MADELMVVEADQATPFHVAVVAIPNESDFTTRQNVGLGQDIPAIRCPD